VYVQDELDSVREYSGDKEALGRVEMFFLTIGEIDRLGPRLQALQVTQQFGSMADSLRTDVRDVVSACGQVRSSFALRQLLQRVLALGNYLNGTSFRGGAYGFKLADLSKLVQVKSGDSKTTLLHYLAKLTAAAPEAERVDALKLELSDVGRAKDLAISEKKGEIAKLSSNFKLAEREREACGEGDPYTPLLSAFIGQNEAGLAELQEAMPGMEAKLKELAKWLGDKPTAGPEELFSPISAFLKELEKAHKDNVRAEAEERKRAAGGGVRKNLGGGVGGVGGGMPKPDGNMMLEMQLKMAKRAERVAEASGKTGETTTAQQQRWLANNMMANGATAQSAASGEAGVGANLADGAASGALFAQRRVSRMGTSRKMAESSFQPDNPEITE